MLALSDYIPFVCMISCIKIGSEGKWDAIMSSYLRGPNQEDLTTECGSHILDQLNEQTNGSLLLDDHFNQKVESFEDIDIITLDLTFESLPEKGMEIRANSMDDGPSQSIFAT